MLGALSDYIDGELEERLCAAIQAHLRECPECQVMVDTLNKTVILYRKRGEDTLPSDVRARLYAILDLEAE